MILPVIAISIREKKKKTAVDNFNDISNPKFNQRLKFNQISGEESMNISLNNQKDNLNLIKMADVTVNLIEIKKKSHIKQWFYLYTSSMDNQKKVNLTIFNIMQKKKNQYRDTLKLCIGL